MEIKVQYGLLVIAVGSGELLNDPVWLKSYDPDIHAEGAPYPTGMIETTDDPLEAMKFDSKREAMECWNTQSTVVPYRPDGRPNKPLTAFTVEIKSLPGVKFDA